MERLYGFLEVSNVLDDSSVWNGLLYPMAERFILWKHQGKAIRYLNSLCSNRFSVSYWQRGSDTFFNGKRGAKKKEAFTKKGRTSFCNCNIQKSSDSSQFELSPRLLGCGF